MACMIASRREKIYTIEKIYTSIKNKKMPKTKQKKCIKTTKN